MVLSRHVELVQREVEHSRPEALVTEAALSHQAVAVIAYRPSGLNGQHWIAEWRDGPAVNHVGLWLNDRRDREVMMMMVVMVTMMAHCSKLQVRFSILSALNSLVVVLQEVEGGISVHGHRSGRWRKWRSRLILIVHRKCISAPEPVVVVQTFRIRRTRCDDRFGIRRSSQDGFKDRRRPDIFLLFVVITFGTLLFGTFIVRHP